MSWFQAVDHIAVVVADTEEALRFYRDELGLPHIFSEILEEQGVRLTHLDLGALHLQLVQPLAPEHPLAAWLKEHGEGLHHLCFRVADISQALRNLNLPSRDAHPRRGPRGRKAVFLEPGKTREVLIELTAEPPN